MDSNFGEVSGVYIDRAKSGKDTNRPELQKMLLDIQESRINLVMASELSRIPRSIKDFSEIWEMMKRHNCDFLSLRENFDTTTAADEMVLYTVANIAQFERRQVSERVAANIKARSERGLYNGGAVILGYKVNPDRAGHLLIDNEAKDTVVEAFNAFLKEGTLSSGARYLNENGFRARKHVQGGGSRPRLGHFTVDNLHKMLINKTYIGIKVFKDGNKRVQVKAVWEPIINKSTFDRVQQLLKKNHQRKKPHSKTRFPYLLSGITYCMSCGDVMCGKSAHGNGGKIGYYEHSWATKKESCLTKKTFSCSPHRVLAKKLEPLVLDKIQSYICNDDFALKLLKRAQSRFKDHQTNNEARKIKARVQAVEGQLDALAERLSTIPTNISAVPIFNQMEILQNRKSELETAYLAAQEGFYPRDTPIEFESLKKLTSGLEKLLIDDNKSELKAKIIQKLVSKIEIGTESVKIHFWWEKRS